MPRPGIDRRPGAAPPAPPVKKPRFSHLAPPPARFLDWRTGAFLLACAALAAYAVDRIWFHGVAYGALEDALRQAGNRLRG